MGIPFSGDWGRRSGRLTVDDCRSIDVRQWHRQGRLEPGTSFTLRWAVLEASPAGAMSVFVKGDRLAIDGMAIQLIWTGRGFKGKPQGRRVWFLCPRCSRRCCLLYSQGGPFACRICMGLSYPSENESTAARAARRAWRAIQQAAFDVNRKHGKPKWMRWPTFWRRAAKAEAAEEVVARFEGRFDALLKKADAIPVPVRRRRSRKVCLT